MSLAEIPSLAPFLTLQSLTLISPITTFLTISLSSLIIYLISTWTRLNHIPGPFWAAFSNLNRMRWVFTGRAHQIHMELHKQYGDLVRFGPNMVSVADPAAIPIIYPLTKRGFVKSPFYQVLQPYSKGKSLPALFPTSDEDIHWMLKKPIVPIFSLSNVKLFERYVDSTMEVLFHQLDKLFVEPETICNLGLWLQMFAFDTMGEITFSQRLGFLEEAGDVDGVMGKIWNHFKASAPVTQMPWIDKFLYKNKIAAYFKPPTSSPILNYAAKRVKKRRETEKSWGGPEVNNRDFLSRFLEAQAKDPKCPEWAVIVWVFSNILAGSDSTAVVLRTLWYNILTSKKTMQSLRAELQVAKDLGKLAMPCAWSEVRDLPYLTACINEAVRMIPPFGLPFERVVPAGGVEVCGKWFKGGTILGMSAWVVNNHKPTFGEDVAEWRPERWLCEPAKRRAMEQAIMTFGAGKRVCMGRNIAYLEMFKLVPSMLERYDVEIVNKGDWKYENFWFVTQTGLNVRLKKRTNV